MILLNEFFTNVLAVLLSVLSGVVPVHEDLSATTTAKVVKVIDGDTISVLINGREERIRYIGIDTPEPYAKGDPECGSFEAGARNQVLLAGGEVTLVSDQEDRDEYDRLLRYVYVGDTFVNETLIREGYADVLSIQPNTRYASHFKGLRDQAREAKLGMWSVCR